MKKLLAVVHSVWNWIVSLWKKLFSKTVTTEVPKKIKKHIEFWIGKYQQSKGVGITIDVSSEESLKPDSAPSPDECRLPEKDVKGKHKSGTKKKQ